MKFAQNLHSSISINAFAAAPPGQELDKALGIVESSLIEFFMAQGHELLTKAGLKFPRHTIAFEGNRKGSSLVPKGMNTRKRAVVSRSKYLRRFLFGDYAEN